jgi:catechol 2,3-dioxygenase-like lactoylglutathione lyase family enzyme
MARLGYVTIGSNDLNAAKTFYDALLGSAGFGPMFEHPSGGRIYGKDTAPVLGVLGPFDGRPATAGNGTMIAIHFDSKPEVDAFHSKALALGGANEGAPGMRGPNAYFAYFRDLDGNKICAFSAS